MSPQDDAQFLAASPERRRLLDRLRSDPGTPRELADALDVAHRSVQRNLAALVDRDWAEKRDGRYRLTTLGAVVAREHGRYLDRLDDVDATESLVRHLPDAGHVPDPASLAEATVVVGTPTNPQAPLDHYAAALKGASPACVRMVAPVLSRRYHEVHARLVAAGVRTELVMAADTVETARELNPREFEFVLGVDRFTLFRHPDDVGVGLTLADGRVLLGAYDEEGRLRALADGTDESLVGWARDRYRRYRSAATRVRPDDRGRASTK